MPAALTDVMDALAGVKPGSALDAVRNRRPQAREQAEASFRALFEPESFAGVSARHLPLGQAFLGKRLEPRLPIEQRTGEDSGSRVERRFDDLVGHDRGLLCQAVARIRSPAATRIWNDRKAMICDSVTMSVVDQPASSSVCSLAGAASRGWKTRRCA
jgi:hypothetical protein